MRQLTWEAVHAGATAAARTLQGLIRREGEKEIERDTREALARKWGRLNPQSVVRHVPHGTTFVHCHECRWPVNPGRTHMLLGNEQRTEATEEQMQRICEGVRKHMEAT